MLSISSVTAAFFCEYIPYYQYVVYYVVVRRLLQQGWTNDSLWAACGLCGLITWLQMFPSMCTVQGMLR